MSVGRRHGGGVAAVPDGLLAFDHALLSWSKPRVNGAPDPATRCTPYNRFDHTFEPDISNATVEFYALPTTGIYYGVNGYARHYLNSRPYEVWVDPDASAYNWGAGGAEHQRDEQSILAGWCGVKTDGGFT